MNQKRCSFSILRAQTDNLWSKPASYWIMALISRMTYLETNGLAATENRQGQAAASSA